MFRRCRVLHDGSTIQQSQRGQGVSVFDRLLQEGVGAYGRWDSVAPFSLLLALIPSYINTHLHICTLSHSHSLHTYLSTYLPTYLPTRSPTTLSPTSHHPHTTTTCARRRIFGRAGRVSNPPKWCSGWCWRGAWARARGLHGAPEAAGTSRPAVQPEGPPSLIPSLFPSFLHSFLLSFLSSFLPRTLLHLSFFEQPCYVPSITHVTPSSFIQ